MSTIYSVLTQHHNQCDSILELTKSAINHDKWQEADNHWKNFQRELNCHIEQEEDVLFPAFEEKTGMTQGPTMVMRMEHVEIKQLMTNVQSAINSENSNDGLNALISLVEILVQHNMKEEQILYPMSDSHLDNNEEIAIEIAQKLSHR
ncbi:hemerythrin domain-containing protein [Vibrio sp. SS-MA-C1-2]|uniref:hemerythrin domain-containing protein n=1 Tax=Vibrio sp. SS-MA-C1-2 TaxID=2908646 RepID=UPI001F1DB906|nr:hemerythrin domain-containing protein [Vibrio sp. SS-MA-C1-2]UJF17864.1 hemerythrin domain-containing protein [Vibrio sp. SS-MA-C1-2]